MLLTSFIRSSGAMACVLLRHGTAEEEGARPLAEQGRTEARRCAEKVVSYLKELKAPGEAPGEVYVGHSGKLRAQQTADLVAEALRGAGWKARRSGRVMSGLRRFEDQKLH